MGLSLAGGALWALLLVIAPYFSLSAQQTTGAEARRDVRIKPESRDWSQKPDEVIKAMELRPGQVVVDIGAGHGYFTRRFALAVAPTGRAIGLEVEERLVRDLKADAKKLGLENYEARLVPFDDPQLAPASADVIFLCDTYHHIDGRAAYFARVRDALREGGRLVVIDFPPSRGDARHGIEKAKVIEELTRAGYKLLREFDLLAPRQFFLEFAPSTEEM